jgi:hypothetical protein
MKDLELVDWLGRWWVDHLVVMSVVVMDSK